VKRKPEQRKPDRTANGIARFRPRNFIGSARIREMSRITKVRNTAAKPLVGAALPRFHDRDCRAAKNGP
jgi:hypothetical protein